MSLPSCFTLNTGDSIPAVGFGTFQSAPHEVKAAVETALEAGYRHIDGAAIYGNEKEVGEAVAASKISREEIFITGKLWNNKHRPEDVEEALDKTLEDLNTPYLDLYLVHWPVVFKSGDNQFPIDDSGLFILDNVPIADTWAAMEKVLASGKTKAIGVSNFNMRRIEELLSSAKIVPAVNQIEAHPYLQQSNLVEYCRSKGILIQAYSPMGNNETGLPRAIDDDAIKALAENAGMDVGQLLVSWAVQRETVVLPKSVTKKRIESNFQVKKLSPATFDAVTAMEKHFRYNFPARWGSNVFDELEKEEVEQLAWKHAHSNLELWGPNN